MELFPPSISDQHRIIHLLAFHARVPDLVGVLYQGLKHFGIHRIQNGEKIAAVGPSVLRGFIGEISHKICIIGFQRKYCPNRKLVVLRYVDGVDIFNGHELLFIKEQEPQIILIKHAQRRAVELHYTQWLTNQKILTVIPKISDKIRFRPEPI